MSINNVTLSGRLVSDAKITAIPNGTNVANFTVATTRSYRDAQGESIKNTSFIDCCLFRKSIDFAKDMLQKGKFVAVSGRLDQQKWEDKKTGENRSKIVVFVENFDSGGSGRENTEESTKQSNTRETEEKVPF